MKNLKSLLARISYECVQGTLDREVTDIIYDSRKVTKDSLFVCIKGAVVDGHKFAAQAVEAGASVLLVQEEVALPEAADVTVIRVESTNFCTYFILVSIGNFIRRNIAGIILAPMMLWLWKVQPMAGSQRLLFGLPMS